MHPPDGPPVCTALTAALDGAPPPISSTISAIVMPIGTSTRPVFFILPTSEKILVPEFRSVPTRANASAPLAMITGTLAQVSTLLIAVGLPSMPRCTG